MAVRASAPSTPIKVLLMGDLLVEKTAVGRSTTGATETFR